MSEKKKAQKGIESRLTEVRYETLDTSKMLNMYIAEKVVKTWKEDFIDEDTKEVVSVERSQPLYAAGTLINQDVLAKIKFDIASGDIKTPIMISNQCRDGYEYRNTALHPWMAKVAMNDKNIKFLLYAMNIDNVLTILRDYVELHFKGGFIISEVKEFDRCVILQDTLGERMNGDDLDMQYLRGDIDMNEYITARQNTAVDKGDDPTKEEAKKYYQFDLTIKYVDSKGDEGEQHGNFVVHTFDVERALIVIKAFLQIEDDKRKAEAEKDGREYHRKTFTLAIEKCVPIPVGCFIPLEFSQVYEED